MKLRAAREKSGMTQKQVAEKAHIHERLYQDYEYNKRKPAADIAARVAGAVGSTVEKIWGEQQSEPDGGQT